MRLIMEESIINSLFEQSLTLGVLSSGVVILWRSLNQINAKMLTMLEETTKVIERNTQTYITLEKMLEAQQAQSNTYWQQRITEQDKHLTDILNTVDHLERHLLKNGST